MGNTLSFPSIRKESTTGGNARFLYSTTAMQGWRLNMEDTHAADLSLDEGEKTNAFFGVYDGHGGDTVSKFSGVNVHKRLVTEQAYREKQYEEALKRAFLGTDEDFLADPAHAKDSSGCTAIAALVTGDDKIYVANAGDSRSVLSVKGKVKPLSFDHKPSNKTEKDRIIAAGGHVAKGRVNGDLALSRALGDFKYKKNKSLGPENQIVTANPEVTVHDITEEDEFIVIACDGIWDCLSSQEVVDFVRLKIFEGQELNQISEMLCDYCLSPESVSTDHLRCGGCAMTYCTDCTDLLESGRTSTGCDNMTVVIVAILNGRTKDEWYTWITDRVRENYGYKTPRYLPRIYAENKLKSFKAQREAKEERDRRRAAQGSSDSEETTQFVMVEDDTGGIALMGGPSGLRGDMVRSALVNVLTRY